MVCRLRQWDCSEGIRSSPGSQRISDASEQLVGTERLAEELGPRPLVRRSPRPPAEDQDGYLPGLLLKPEGRDYLFACDLGHALIDKDHVWQLACGKAKRFLAVGGKHGAEAFSFQHHLDGHLHAGIVFRDQNEGIVHGVKRSFPILCFC
jgi:hypothetical protein